jgi:DNA-binding GntR family transcriptional regulator
MARARQPANPASADAAHAAIRRAIMRLELAPGAGVSEGQLIDRFGYSKAATRAALARLRTESLVEAEARRGHFVAPLTMRDVLEVYDLRLLLEPAAARRAAERMDAAELTRLQQLAAGSIDVRTAKGMERFAADNRAIHLGIVTAGGNRRATRLVDRLLDESERARLVALRAGAAGGGDRGRAELRDVLAALAERDGDRAGRLMAATIGSFRDELVDSLRQAALDLPLGIADA